MLLRFSSITQSCYFSILIHNILQSDDLLQRVQYSYYSFDKQVKLSHSGLHIVRLKDNKALGFSIK